jgi:SAM-dependent methyltransferase
MTADARRESGALARPESAALRAPLGPLGAALYELRSIVRAGRRAGLPHAVRTVGDRVADRLAEHALGFRSGGVIPIETLIPRWQDCHDYRPSTIAHVRALLDGLGIGPHDVFVDYGAGLGRALALAAAYPFRRLVGVEIAPALVARARANLARSVPAARLAAIELWQGNAADYVLPDDATVLYFYNPFHGAVLRRALDEIRRSLRAAPRRVTVAFNNPVHARTLVPEYPELRLVRTYAFEYACDVYEAGPA